MRRNILFFYEADGGRVAERPARARIPAMTRPAPNAAMPNVHDAGR
jgi:hypothetical protein